MISIHAPARGATEVVLKSAQTNSFQSTLPRGERRKRRAYKCCDIPISIHAPARGATRSDEQHEADVPISIHAPARGATSPQRSDSRCTWNNFNPRSREGSDGKIFASLLEIFDFNPRSREGSDFAYRAYYAVLSISIHAPARGATSSPSGTASRSFRFQSTLPRGERRIFADPCVLPPYISIHAPARGATGNGKCRSQIFYYFNPRSREGSDCFSVQLIRITELFQSTLPRGERLQFYLKFTLCF